MLSRTSEYAIRALAYLGAQKGRPFVLGRIIAEDLGMPSPFLGKVLQVMAATGLLQSQRGRGGGFKLLRDAKTVTLLEIVEPFDHPADRTRCLLGQKRCSETRSCSLHDAWNDTRNAFLSALRETTLADVERAALRGVSSRNARAVKKPRPVRRRRRGSGSTRRRTI